jgi:hypothetical protein
MANPSVVDAKQDEYSPEETTRRRDEAIRRALNTPRKPNEEYIGKSERAKVRKRSRVKKAVR